MTHFPSVRQIPLLPGTLRPPPLFQWLMKPFVVRGYAVHAGSLFLPEHILTDRTATRYGIHCLGSAYSPHWYFRDAFRPGIWLMKVRFRFPSCLRSPDRNARRCVLISPARFRRRYLWPWIRNNSPSSRQRALSLHRPEWIWTHWKAGWLVSSPHMFCLSGAGSHPVPTGTDRQCFFFARSPWTS